jgi:hypothetical protein
MAEEKEQVGMHERTHPLYNDYVREWDFYEESALGGMHYNANEDNLFTHRLEDWSGDYSDRFERTYYLNFCDLVCRLYADYIFKEIVRRPTDPLLDAWRENTDGRGTNIDAFMNNVSYLSSVYGQVHIIVDAPYARDINVPMHIYKEDKAKRFDPYAVIVIPQDLRDWSVDEFGNYDWVLIRSRDYNDSDPHKDREDATTYRLITRDIWEVYNAEGDLIKSGVNELGEVYMVTAYNTDSNLDVIGESVIKDIARINRTIYNWCSNIDEMIERQTFSQLVMPEDPNAELHEGDEGGDPLRVIGTSQIFTFPSTAGHPPSFISPDRQQIDAIWKMIQQHIDKIYELSGLGTVGSQSKFLSQRSGISQAYQFLSINSSLARKAKKLEDAENEIEKLVMKWQNAEKDEPVEYPTQFDTLSLEETANSTFNIVGQNFSTTLNIEMLKALAKKAAPVLPTETLQEIYNEIEENEGVLMNPLIFGAGGGGFGAFGGGPPGDKDEVPEDEESETGLEKS